MEPTTTIEFSRTTCFMIGMGMGCLFAIVSGFITVRLFEVADLLERRK